MAADRYDAMPSSAMRDAAVDAKMRGEAVVAPNTPLRCG